jgi:hypothetical protein
MEEPYRDPGAGSAAPFAGRKAAGAAPRDLERGQPRLGLQGDPVGQAAAERPRAREVRTTGLGSGSPPSAPARPITPLPGVPVSVAAGAAVEPRAGMAMAIAWWERATSPICPRTDRAAQSRKFRGVENFPHRCGRLPTIDDLADGAAGHGLLNANVHGRPARCCSCPER